MMGSMIDDFPKLNEDFTRNAIDYRGGNLLLMVDGSGGMTVAYGASVNPDPVICTLASGLSVQAQTGVNVFATYWGETKGGVDIDLKGNEDGWRRQMPNGQTLLLPALEQLVSRLGALDKNMPLHIIFVSDGILSDGDPNATMEKLDAVRKIPGIAIDIVITEKEIHTAPHDRAPLAAMAHTLNLAEEGFAIGVAHANGPDMLQAAIRDFVEARMKPEFERHLNTVATMQATMNGLQHAIRPLKPPTKWKTPEST